MLYRCIMSLPSRHLTALASVTLLLATAPALGQGDTLEQPYDSSEPQTPEAAPPQPAPSSVAAPARPVQTSEVVVASPLPDTRPLGPIRARRRLALTGEVGWNGIAGFGAVLSYHIVPQLTGELGAGVSFTGWKAGVRGRYNFLTTPVTPFIGAGLMGTSGIGDVTGDFDGDDPDSSTNNPDEVTIRVRPSAFFQAVVGIDWTSRSGFTLVGALGWAAVLNHNLDIIAGNPTKDEREAFDILFRSGPVVTVATGYTFE
jgi:hypothetical protein